MMDIVMPETCWAYKKYNKISSCIQLVFLFFLLDVQDWWFFTKRSFWNFNVPGEDKIYLMKYREESLILRSCFIAGCCNFVEGKFKRL